MKQPLHLLVARLVNNSTLTLPTVHQSMISTPPHKSTWTVSKPMSKLGTRPLVSTTESKANGPTAHQLMYLSTLVNLSNQTLGALWILELLVFSDSLLAPLSTELLTRSLVNNTRTSHFRCLTLLIGASLNQIRQLLTIAQAISPSENPNTLTWAVLIPALSTLRACMVLLVFSRLKNSVSVCSMAWTTQMLLTQLMWLNRSNQSTTWTHSYMELLLTKLLWHLLSEVSVSQKPQTTDSLTYCRLLPQVLQTVTSTV